LKEINNKLSKESKKNTFTEKCFLVSFSKALNRLNELNKTEEYLEWAIV